MYQMKLKALAVLVIAGFVTLAVWGCSDSGKKEQPAAKVETKEAKPAPAKESPLDKWKPDFDPSTAKYKCIISNVSHPVIKGVYTGFLLRDELWKRTNGQIYVDFKPLSMLGGEVEVLNQLQMGAIQGMESEGRTEDYVHS